MAHREEGTGPSFPMAVPPDPRLKPSSMSELGSWPRKLAATRQLSDEWKRQERQLILVASFIRFILF